MGNCIKIAGLSDSLKGGNQMRKHWNVFALTIVISFVITGCSLFTSHYDATRHENFTKLKAFHVKFIEDYTEGSEKEWNKQAILEICDQGDLKFKEALVYAASKDTKDNTGANAVRYLRDQFKENCSSLLKRKVLFSKGFSSELLNELELQYDYAIAGELRRVGAPQ
jgi:hypothetical protein